MTNVHVTERIHEQRHTDEREPVDHGATRSGGDDASPVTSNDASTWRTTVRDLGQRVGERLQPLWSRPLAALAVAAGLGATWGLAAGSWTPRGPLVTSEAIWSIVISLVVGLGAGLAAKSRWALLVAPIAFAAVFEVVRLGVDGPTVDGIVFSSYGALAVGLGRGVHALLSLFPMAFGAALGAGTARSIDSLLGSDDRRGRRVGLIARRAVACVLAVGLLVFSLALLRPASTDAIRDADGNVIPGSIAELTQVDVNGHDLGLMIRGHSIDNPVVLFLAGGPGGSEYGAMRRHLSELEEHVTVVTWDQRGSGTSYDELDPTDTLTLQGTIDDTIAVTEYLRNRFDTEQVILLGQSWGTTLGVLAVQERPELFRAFVGTGQMVSQRATDIIFYDDTLAWAEETGRDGLADELRDIGPPPYDDILDYETALASEQQVYAYDHSQNSEGEGQMSENLLVSEYTLLDQLHVLPAFLDVFSVLYPQLQDVDFRETATDFEVPMFFAQGAHEAGGRADLFADWYPMIDAPIVDLTVLDTSGHRPLFEQPDEFVDYMTDTVLPLTAPDSESPDAETTAAEEGS